MKVIKYLALSFLAFITGHAQNIMTSSPYSMFGVGEIVTGLYGSNAAMGGVSTGMRNAWLINMENPAGLTGLDTLRLFAEAAAFLKSESYQSKSGNSHAFTGNVSAFSLAGRIVPRWYMAAGLTPYSSVGYYFQSTQPLEGSPDSYYTSLFEGYGGLSKVYLTNAFMLNKNLSVGVNLSYIFGNIKLTESQSNISVEDRMYTHNFYADFGLQYHRPLTHDVSFTIGAVYGYKQRLKLENSVAITYSSSEAEQSKRNSTQYLPQFFGIGSSLVYKKWTYAFDYSFHQYSSFSSGDSRVKFKDSHELKTGISYYPNGYTSGSYWKRITYKAGIDLSTPYMQINGESGYSYRINAGLSLPVMNGRIHTAFYYDHTQFKNNVFARDAFGVTVSYTLSELFYKLKL